MKYLIFSDTHLTDKFDKRKYNFLKEKISLADKVVIAGDFYEKDLISLEQLLTSAWKKLFPLLKEKNATYIPGNHDKLTGTKKEYAFCNEIMDKYTFISGKQKCIVQHGHRIQPGFAKVQRLIPRPLRGLIISIIRNIEGFLSSLFKWQTPRIFFYRHYDLQNTIEYKCENIENKVYLILGHTHLPYQNNKIKYANCGYIMHGLGAFVTIDNGVVKLHKETY